MERPQDFEKVVNISFGVVIVSCLAVGLSGYFMFGSFVLDQVTLSLEQNSSAEFAMMILTYLMILTAFSKLTLTMFPLAIGMEEIVAPFVSTDEGMEVVSMLIKVILLISALFVALFVPSFSEDSLDAGALFVELFSTDAIAHGASAAVTEFVLERLRLKS